MSYKYAASIVLEAHLPYVKEYKSEENLTIAGEEIRFFEYVSETLLPLLGVFDRLENDQVPFRIALVMSPVLCQMLCDEHLINKYLDYTNKQIEFGEQEIKRTAKLSGDLKKIAEDNYNKIIDRRIVFTERYERNIIKTIDFYRYKEKVEILASGATHVFLPFLDNNSESMQAQIEVPLSSYRRFLGGSPQGFWIPELGWTPSVEPFLRAYNFTYTIVDSHGLLFGNPLPKKGSFYPVKTENGTFVLARDYYAVKEINRLSQDELFLDNERDIGFELPTDMIKIFLSEEGERHKTGYKYWSKADSNTVYNSKLAEEKSVDNVRMFLEDTLSRLSEASKYMEETPLSLYAGNADIFGRHWHEGCHFLETLFRMAEGYRDLQFVHPSEYIFKQNLSSFQTVTPEFSSWETNGYAQTWLDASNDWIYRHLARAMERMTELAERFPDDTGLKERALNQAAREILLAQSSDWPALLYKQESTEYARAQLENSLRNFTTIYEALGSNYISTEWLTNLERKHSLFPNINYRVFRRKNNHTATT